MRGAMSRPTFNSSTEYARHRAAEGRANSGERSGPSLCARRPLARQWAVRGPHFDAFYRDMYSRDEKTVADSRPGRQWLAVPPRRLAWPTSRGGWTSRATTLMAGRRPGIPERGPRLFESIALF